MGSYDGAEICELVGLFMLNKLAQRFGGDNVGLYRDDGLLLLKGTGGRQAELARQQLHETFKKFNLRITAEINYHTLNFLDVTFNLKEERYIPYCKPNNDPLYIDSQSNHPPCIIKQLPVSINKRLCSSDEKSFESIAPIYEDALKRSRFNVSYLTRKSTRQLLPRVKQYAREILSGSIHLTVRTSKLM